MSTRTSTHQDTIEAPSGTHTTTRQKVTVGHKTMVITEYHKEWSTIIYIGSETIYCIDITLYKALGGRYQSRGILTKIRWDGECSLYHPFEQGTDTIMIFQLAMTYVHRNYPTVTEMSFNDLSTRQCENGASVSLSAMKLFTEGKTWYESHFHAIMDRASEAPYQAMMTYATEQKSLIPWEEFVQYTSNHSTLLRIPHIKEIYQSSKTWQEFFLYLRKQLGVVKFCVFLSEKGWFDSFIQGRLRFQLMSVQYLIDPSQYDTEYTLEPMQGGKAKGVQHGRPTLRKKPRHPS